MEKRRRLGRGLEDISHYFISQDISQDQKKEEYTSQRADTGTRCEAISIVDLFDPRRGALLTSRIGAGLCRNGIRTLLIDTDISFPGIAFVLGLSVPGYSLRHYSKNQYQAADIVCTGPFGLKILAPRFCGEDIYRIKEPEISLMFETLISVERETDIVILRQYEKRLKPFIEEAIFITPAQSTGMIRVYREIKSFIAGMDRKRIGIVITDALNEYAAMDAYEKISRCIEMSGGIKTYFHGYLADNAAFSPERIISHISEVALNNRKKTKDRMLLFERLRYQTGAGSLSVDEVANLLY